VKELGRILVPLVTPFKENGDIDHSRLAELAERTLNLNFGDSLIVGGTTGEFSQLSTAERKAVMKTVKEAVGDRCPVIAGTGSSNLREAIELTQYAEQLGLDMAMVVGPYYTKPTQEGVYQYYKAIAESTSLPVMLYNIPLFTGVNCEPQTFARLLEIENIVAIKEEAGINPLQMSDYILEARKRKRVFRFFDGDDTMILPVLVQGGEGVVSGGAQVIGDKIRQMIDLFFSNRVEEAKEMHLKVYRLFQVFGLRVNPVPLVKEALNMSGFWVGKPRLPLTPATDEEKKRLRETLSYLGVI